jgi:uncharacterized RDD family membrane protein YckC
LAGQVIKKGTELNTSDPTQSKDETGKPAGFFSRLEAFIIDLFVILLASLGGIGLVILIIRFFVRPFFDLNINLVRYYPQMVTVTIVVYYLFFWALFGFTPGKFLLGLKIVRQDGRKLGLGRAIVRFIGYWISAIFLFLGFIWIIFDSRREAWHDKLADTHVIYVWKIKKKNPGKKAV